MCVEFKIDYDNINFNKQNIINTKSVILVESEKTVMKFDDWYGSDKNICLGLYGSNLSDEKIDLFYRGSIGDKVF